MDPDELKRIQGFRDRMNGVTNPRHPATHKRTVTGRTEMSEPPLQFISPEYNKMMKEIARRAADLLPGHYNVTQVQDSFVIEPMEGQPAMNRKQMAAEAAAVSARLAQIQQELGKFEAWPEDDDNMPAGTIIKFARMLGKRVPVDNSTPTQHVHYDHMNRAYSSEAIPEPGHRQRMRVEKVEFFYAGIKGGDNFWYVTGGKIKPGESNGLDWDELLDAIIPNIESFAYQLPYTNEWVYIVGDDLEGMKADDTEQIASSEGTKPVFPLKGRPVKDNPQA